MFSENGNVVLRFVEEVINDGNYSSMQELLHPDYVYRSPGLELQGHDALQALFTDYRNGIPDLEATIDDLVETEDKVVISITLSGTHTGELMGIPATGKSLSVQGMVMSRLENGKIVEEREILDMLGMFRQLDVITPPS